MRAVLLDVWDYKQTFKREEALSDSEEDRLIKRLARKECHLRSAQRMLEALKALVLQRRHGRGPFFRQDLYRRNVLTQFDIDSRILLKRF
jgi:hypothetical protein